MTQAVVNTLAFAAVLIVVIICATIIRIKNGK